MTTQTPKPKNDSSDKTVIGFEGSEQHHDLKNNPGEKGDPDHAKGAKEADKTVGDAVAKSEEDTAVTSAFKDAVEKS